MYLNGSRAEIKVSWDYQGCKIPLKKKNRKLKEQFMPHVSVLLRSKVFQKGC